jgi:hypothetical protein
MWTDVEVPRAEIGPGSPVIEDAAVVMAGGRELPEKAGLDLRRIPA